MSTSTKEPPAHITVNIGDGTPEEIEAAAQQAAGALFDRSQYEREDLAIPKVDGQTIDRIRLDFSGSVFLDRSNPQDVALYNRLTLKGDVTLMVEGRCSDTGAKGATDRDGNLDVIVGHKKVRVHTVYLSTIDGLEARGVTADQDDDQDGGQPLDEAA